MDVCDVCDIRNNGLQHVINGHSASLAYWLNIIYNNNNNYYLIRILFNNKNIIYNNKNII